MISEKFKKRLENVRVILAWRMEVWREDRITDARGFDMWRLFRTPLARLNNVWRELRNDPTLHDLVRKKSADVVWFGSNLTTLESELTRSDHCRTA